MTAAWVDRAYSNECDVESSSKAWIKWHISFYRSYACLINIFNSYIFNSFRKFIIQICYIKNTILYIILYKYNFYRTNALLYFSIRSNFLCRILLNFWHTKKIKIINNVDFHPWGFTFGALDFFKPPPV